MQTIELTDEEALLFLKFRENQDTFSVLEESGVFNIRNGHAVLNFDANGTLGAVECTVKLYRRGVAVIPILVQLRPTE